MDVPAEKRCIGPCQTIKSLDEFYRDKSRKDGHRERCKECVNADRDKYAKENPGKKSAECKKYYAKHRDRINQQQREEYAKDPEKFLVKNKKSYTKHREKRLIYNAEYREKNRESINQNQRNKIRENPEANRQHVRQWRIDFPERAKESDRNKYKKFRQKIIKRVGKWRRNNPEKTAIYHKREHEKYPYRRMESKQRRRAREKDLPIIEKVNPLDIAERDGWKCHICHKPVTRGTMSLDHLIPVIARGPHIASNLALCHRVCNSRMGPGRFPAQLRLF